MTENKFYEEFDKFYVDMPDCVCTGVKDYENVLNKIFNLTNGLLVLKKFEGKSDDNGNYTLKLVISDVEYVYEFKGSEYFNQDLLQEFNRIIEVQFPSEKRKLIEISDGIDIDFGVAFFERKKEYELAKSGKIWRSEDWIRDFELNSKN
ncbi:MAG: hypothetical protein ACRC8Z_08910 [Empedobacter falsenii]